MFDTTGGIMADILIRDVPLKTKLLLEERAAQHGRSRNDEILAILETTLAPRQRTWFDMLREVADDTDGAELEMPTWAEPHDAEIE